MAESGIQGLGTQAASAYARADILAAPVRPVAPAQPRPRFDLGNLGGDLGQVVRPPVQPAAGEADGKAAKSPAFPPVAAPARGSGQAANYAAYQAQAIAQQDEGGTPGKSAFLAGSQAYARQSGAEAPVRAAADILMPFPRLASGRALDLTV